MTAWHELKPDCYGILDILQFNFLRAFSGLPYIGWDPIPEYMGMARRKEYTLARKIAWIMAANVKEKKLWKAISMACIVCTLNQPNDNSYSRR